MKNWGKAFCTAGIVSVFWYLSSACYSEPVYTPVIRFEDHTDYSMRQIHRGKMVDKNIRIVAKDGSFELQGGKMFDSPFSCDLWGATTRFKANDNNIVESYQQAREAGCKEVLIYIDGKDEPLNGILALSRVYNAAVGPASHAYFVKVDTNRLVTAYDGNTVVFYEKAKWTKNTSKITDGRRKDSAADYNYYTWVLWAAYTPL